MQVQEAFKIGFLSRCVEEGLSSENTHKLAKMAATLFEKEALINVSPTGEARNAVGILRDAAPYLLAGLAIPPALGGAAAYLANTAMETGGNAEQGVATVKREELQTTYERLTAQLQRQKELRDYKSKRKSTGRVFL